MRIPVILKTRMWMVSQKSWRCFFELPDDDGNIIAAQLTAYIETRMNIVIAGSDGSTVEMKPAFIKDVPNKGKRFSLVAETVFEAQASIGPFLTGMVGDRVTIELSPITTEAPATPTPKEKQEGTIGNDIIKSLHGTLFKNISFWKYCSEKMGGFNIESPEECKETFKAIMRVNSCTEITKEAFYKFMNGFQQAIQ